MYDKLVTKVNVNLLKMNIIDSKVLKNSALVSTIQVDSNKQNFEKKIEILIRRTLILEDKSRRVI